MSRWEVLTIAESPFRPPPPFSAIIADLGHSHLTDPTTPCPPRCNPLRGRARRGECLLAAVPWGHWKTTTFVAGLRLSGLSAPMVLDGAMNGTAFKADAEQVLAPSLKPGDIVIMDNLSSHKVAGVREAIKAVGATPLYPPPSSPDLNPIEQAFAKLKAHLRKASARTTDELWQTIADLIERFPPEECANYFQNSGYGFNQS